MKTRMTAYVAALVLLLPLVLLGSGCENSDDGGTPPGPYECAEEPQCGEDRYANGLPEDAVHVNACCPVDTPDGSLEKPYATIEEGVAAAASGDTVAVAAGTYAPVEISTSVSLIGAGADRCAVVPMSPKTTMIQFLGVQQAALSGLLIAGSLDALASPCHPPTCTDRSALGSTSKTGILVSSSEDVSILDVEVTGHSTAGVVFFGSTGEVIGAWIHDNGTGAGTVGLAIIDGSTVTVGADGIPVEEAGTLADGGCLLEDNNAIGLFVRASAASVLGTKIRANLFGGAAFDALAAEDAVSEISSSQFDDNASFGLSLVNHAANIHGNGFAGTTDCDGDCVGHCVSVTGDDPAHWPQVTMTNNHISLCAGSGILLDGKVIATIEENIIEDVQRWGGIWAQGGVEVVSLTSNVITGTALVGIAVTTGSRAEIVFNRVNDTWEESFYQFTTDSYVNMGDGIVVSQVNATGGVHIEGNEVTNSARAGIIVDGSTAEQVLFVPSSDPEEHAPKVTGSGEAAVVFQNGAEAIAEVENLAEAIGGISRLEDIVTDQLFSIVENMTNGSISSPCVPPACTD